MRPSFSGGAQSGRVGGGKSTLGVSSPAFSGSLTTGEADVAEVADTTGTATISFTLKNVAGVVMVGVPLAFLSLASTGSNNTITAIDSVSDANGRFQWSFSSTTAEAKTLTLTAYGIAVSDTVALTVTGESDLYPNAPAAYTAVTDRPMAALQEASWSFRDYSVGSNNVVGSRISLITNDADGPVSPSTAVDILYPTAFAGGGEAAKMWRVFSSGAAGWRKFYLCVSIKLDTIWQGHSSGINKLLYWNLGNRESNNARFFLSAHGTDNNTLRLRITSQGTPSPSGDQRIFSRNVGVADDDVVTRGTWFTAEALLIGNSTGLTTDGEIHLWINGTKILAYTDVSMWNDLVDPNPFFFGLELTPVWGGAGDTVDTDMHLRYDHCYITGEAV